MSTLVTEMLVMDSGRYEITCVRVGPSQILPIPLFSWKTFQWRVKIIEIRHTGVFDPPLEAIMCFQKGRDGHVQTALYFCAHVPVIKTMTFPSAFCFIH